MKTLAKLIYSFFYFLDEKFGYIEKFDYETAPYCGHHHNGHDGRFTKSHYHEGEGGAELKFKSPFFKIGYCNDEAGFYWLLPTIQTKAAWSFNSEDMGNDVVRYGIKGLKYQLKSKKGGAKHGIVIKLKFSIV